MIQRTQAISLWRVRGLAVLGTLVASLLTVPPTRGDVMINYNSGLCLDVAGASTADGANVIQWTCHGGPNQQVRLQGWQGPPEGPQFTFLMIAQHSQKCLDVAGASTANRAKVHQWTCHFGVNQLWFPPPHAGPNFRNAIRNVHSGKCLEVAGASTSRGATVRQGTCNGGPHQLWIVDDGTFHLIPSIDDEGTE